MPSGVEEQKYPQKESNMPEVTVDQLIVAFVKIRDARSALKRQFTEQDDSLKEKLRRVEVELLRRSQEQGTTGFTTSDGTAYHREEQHVSIADDEVFYEFLNHIEDPYGWFEQRPSLKRIKEYQKANKGALPPGVRMFRELRMGVRRKGEKGEEDGN